MRRISIRFRVMWPDHSISWLPGLRAWLNALAGGAFPISPQQINTRELYAALRPTRRRRT